jgi:hypothetical protein
MITAQSLLANAQQCGDPPRVDNQSLKGDLKACGEDRRVV